MTVGSLDAEDLLVELAGCVSELAEQQLVLRESLSALVPRIERPLWTGVSSGRRTGSAPLGRASQRRQRVGGPAAVGPAPPAWLTREWTVPPARPLPPEIGSPVPEVVSPGPPPTAAVWPLTQRGLPRPTGRPLDLPPPAVLPMTPPSPEPSAVQPPPSPEPSAALPVFPPESRAVQPPPSPQWAQPVYENQASSASASGPLRRDYDYFADLEVRLAQMSADEGESGESE